MPDQPNTHHRPADGERWAVLGFSVQYLLAANLAYECLTNDSLEWVAVADPEAGKVDDFQVGTSHHVQAYQFKWHEHPPSLTFAELVGSDAHPELSLLHSLADGWQKISTANPDKEVIVNLVTNSPASVSDRPANKLGTLSPEGEVVAGSCYWRRGRVSRHPYSDEVASSGWTVWVSEKGFDELTRRFGAAYSQQKVVRSLRDTESKTTSEVTRFFS